MGFLDKLLDREPKCNPEKGSPADPFADPADVSGTAGATPIAPPLPPQPNVSTEETPAQPVAYPDMGLRYVVKMPSGQEMAVPIGYYEHQLRQQLGDLPGVGLDDIIRAQYESGILWTELFYLDGITYEPVKPVEDEELRKLFLKDYDLQKSPPPAPAPQPAAPPQPAPAAEPFDGKAFMEMIARMSPEDRQAAWELFSGSTATPPAPGTNPPPAGDEEDDDDS